MGKILFSKWLPILILIISLSIPIWAQTNTPPASASLEIGGDSDERRFFRPRLRFNFPLSRGLFYFNMDYYQRINSRLQGEVDFWFSIGYQRSLSKTFSLEAEINHLCRHVTSRRQSGILDINEVVTKLRIHHAGIILGLGGGSFLGPSEGHNHLWVWDLQAPHLLDSEFSFGSEVKLIDFKKILYEFELACALDQSLDLFVRYSKHYAYSPLTYLGIRFKSAGKAGDYMGKYRFMTGVYPFYEAHKIIAENEFKLEFLKSPERRVLLTLHGIIPVLRKRNFLGPFRPEEIRYPLSMEYLRSITDGLWAGGYCRYHISMPLDIDEEFGSSMGIGLAVRNQIYFYRFDNPIRFELYAGHNFSHSFDIGFRLGLNSVAKPANIGGDIQWEINPDQWTGQIHIQAEFGREVKIRPYVGYQYLDWLKDNRASVGKLVFGIELVKFFSCAL